MWFAIPPKPLGSTVVRLIALTLALLCAACGSSDSNIGRGGGIGGSGALTNVSIGTITDTGTPGYITVNDDEIDLSRATESVDGEPVAETELAKGMVAIVADNSVAISVDVQTTIKGPVYEAIDSHTLIVLGQRVLVDELTVLVDFSGVTRLVPGDLVEVSGLLKGNGVIAASRIVRKPTLDTMRVTGMIQEFGGIGSVFSIGGLDVDFRGADVSSLPNEFPEDDLVVVVEGEFTVFPGFVPRLLATTVRPAGLASGDKIEGFVTHSISPSEFRLGLDLVVRLDDSTLDHSTSFAGGAADEIVEGTKVLVSGRPPFDFVMSASRVQFRDEIYLESNVLAVDRRVGALTLFSLPGVVVTTNSLTLFAGAIDLDEINRNDHILIRGRVIRGGTIIATRVEKRPASARLLLQAPVDTTFGVDVVLLGVSVGTVRFVDDQFQDVNDNPIGRDAFFEAAVSGTLVRAKGVQGLTALAWEEIELEQ